MAQTRTLKVGKTNAEELITNVLAPILGGVELLTVDDSDPNLKVVTWDMEALSMLQLKAIEKALIERAKLGFLGDSEDAIKEAVTPNLNPALCADCIYYVANNIASLTKFKEEVLVFSGVHGDRYVEIKQPHSLEITQITKSVVIVCNLSQQEIGKIRSNANFKKWGIVGGKVLGNVTSGAGLMAHTIFEEAIAPSAVNLSIAGAKIGKTAIITANKITNVMVDEGSKAVLEVVQSLKDENGYADAKVRLKEAWRIATKKEDSEGPFDDVISF